MKIVIDIPEGMLDELNTCKFPIQDAYRLCDVIENGQPLPKGYGRLIDADAYRRAMLNSREFDFFKTLNMQPTIIEADKEE